MSVKMVADEEEEEKSDSEEDSSNDSNDDSDEEKEDDDDEEEEGEGERGADEGESNHPSEGGQSEQNSRPISNYEKLLQLLHHQQMNKPRNLRKRKKIMILEQWNYPVIKCIQL